MTPNNLLLAHHLGREKKACNSLNCKAFMSMMDAPHEGTCRTARVPLDVRDWCAECTDFPEEVAEMALAHAISDKVEAAYRRGDLLDKRRQLMEHWATFFGGPASMMVPKALKLPSAKSA